MPGKLDVLRLFSEEEPLRPFDLANLLDIKQNYARQIILRLKRQRLIFPHPTLAGGQAYSLTDKGEERISYLADKEKREAERKEKEAVERRKQSGMYLHELGEFLPAEIKKRIRSEFNIASLDQLGSKRLNEVVLPPKVWEESGFLKLRAETKIKHLELPLDTWIGLLKNISKPSGKPQYLPKTTRMPQHLSLEEVLILNRLVQQKAGKFLVTKDGEILHDAGKGYLSMEAAVVLAANRRERRRRGW